MCWEKRPRQGNWPLILSAVSRCTLWGILVLGSVLATDVCSAISNSSEIQTAAVYPTKECMTDITALFTADSSTAWRLRQSQKAKKQVFINTAASATMVVVLVAVAVVTINAATTMTAIAIVATASYVDPCYHQSFD